ncbi:MAG: hypothetical protein KDH96_11295, partial [Candidatus Riesia sp.]|nr:hypothetical protein [Candidatus Riesia sp.]
KYSHIFYNNTLASYKLKTIEMMLDKYGETLHLDTDIIFFNSISNEIKNKKFQAAYAPHYFFKKDSPVSNRFGYFNAGVIWIRDKEFWNEWNDLTKTGNHFFEQKPLEIMYDKGNFDILKLPKTYNFANGNRDRENIHLDGDGFIYYKEDPLINIHVHIFKQNIHLGDNSLEMKKKIKELLHKSKNENYKNIKRVIKKHDKKNFYEF